ncbi:hypothetical protein JXD38_10420 [candidate division WOR-3 bacterium]|nr:hypothetical protein [candidate division WOR-3 bacterium]
MEDINTYLYYGYSVRVDKDAPFPFDTKVFDELDPKGYSQLSVQELVERGKTVLLASVQDELSRTTAKTHVVPLSGGLDSRAILSGLLRSGLKDNIITVTFGAPGSPDYGTARLVAQKAGVRHVEIDIGRIGFSDEAIIDAIGHCSTFVPPFHIFLNRLAAIDEPDSVIWYGFLGGEVTGAHYHADEGDWAAAQRAFARRNRYARRLRLHAEQFSPVSVLPSSPFLPPDKLPFCLQLDYSVRQVNYIRPHFARPGRSAVFPFTNPRFLRYFFSVPRKRWVDQFLYKEILHRYDPALFSLPVDGLGGSTYEQWKSGSRLWRRLGSMRERLAATTTQTVRPAYRLLVPRARGYGYLSYKGVSDFDASLGAVVEKDVHDLQSRGILGWLDMEHVLDAHTSGKQDYARELELLAGLELNLKAEERFATSSDDAN